MQKETIAILGIFAAIVLAFNGAVGFSASSIEAVAMQPSMRNITFIVLLVGFCCGVAGGMAYLVGSALMA